MPSRVRDEVVARRHRNLWQRRGIDHSVGCDEIVGVEQERREVVHLGVAERPRDIGRHRTPDIVENRCGVRPVIANRVRQRRILREGEMIARFASVPTTAGAKIVALPGVWHDAQYCL